MNARFKAQLARRAMTASDVDRVQAVEALAYSFPWTRGNFIDSLAAGYLAEVLECGGELLAYFVAMPGVDELHLLNISVAPVHQGQGHGGFLLDAVQAHGQRLGMAQLLLEVRQSNVRAQALYVRRGFVQVGTRRAYYPAAMGREDAIVMSLPLDGLGHGVV